MTDPPAPEPETPDSAASEPSAPPAADPAASPPEHSEMWAASEPHENLLARTRASETWIALIVFARGQAHVPIDCLFEHLRQQFSALGHLRFCRIFQSISCHETFCGVRNRHKEYLVCVSCRILVTP